jgi:hypothetical protein
MTDNQQRPTATSAHCVCCGGLWRVNLDRLCVDCNWSCRLASCVYNPKNRAARALPDDWQGLRP